MTTLRGGFTTGACAAAAAKAAAMLLCGISPVEKVDVALPDGERVTFPIVQSRSDAACAEAAVRKDAGDDPDVTHGALVVVAVSWMEAGDVAFAAGEGVGTVTKPGLSIPPGEPAINPTPRRMIRAAVREATDRPVKVTISIPGGREMAAKTFNPKLGVEGGLSILGTTGRVRPFSCPALREALRCALRVAAACGVSAPVLVPGHIGERAARAQFRLAPEQVIEVGNEWGFVLDCLSNHNFTRMLIVGHPGKLAKLAVGEWDTHSSRSGNAAEIVSRMAQELGMESPSSPTTEGMFAALSKEDRTRLGRAVAGRVHKAVAERMGGQLEVSIVLVDMRGQRIGSEGDLSTWQ